MTARMNRKLSDPELLVQRLLGCLGHKSSVYRASCLVVCLFHIFVQRDRCHITV